MHPPAVHCECVWSGAMRSTSVRCWMVMTGCVDSDVPVNEMASEER